MSKRIGATLTVLLAITLLVANVTASSSAAMSALQNASATSSPHTPLPRPSPYASPTLSEALVIFEENTLLFTQPDNTSERFFSIPEGAFARLRAVTQDQRWYQIEIGDTVGWVSSTAVQMVGHPTGLYAVVSMTPAPASAGSTPTIAPIATERMVGSFPTVHFENQLAVYPGVSAFYAPIGMVVPGQVAEILAVASRHNRDWYLIRYKNGAGWVTGSLEREIQGDVSQLPHPTILPEPTVDYDRFQAEAPIDLAPLFPSATPSPPLSISPTLAAGSWRAADSIEIILDPDVPAGAFTPDQLTAAAETLQMRLVQYSLSDVIVEVDAAANTILVRFTDNPYRDEIIKVIQQEGLFEAVDFSRQTVELRSVLLDDTILTSGYRAREDQRIHNLAQTYGTSNSDDLAALGFAFSDRRRNPLEKNQPFHTIFTDDFVAGASLVRRQQWDVVISLTAAGSERLQQYPVDRFIAFTMDGKVLAVPLASDVRFPFTLSLNDEVTEARMLVVLLRSRSLPFAMRAREITYLHNR